MVLQEKNAEICDGRPSPEIPKNGDRYTPLLVFMVRVAILLNGMVKLLELELDVLRMSDQELGTILFNPELGIITFASS